MAKKTKPFFWISGNYYDSCKCWKSICAMVDDPNIIVMDSGYNSDKTPADCRSATTGDVILMLKMRDIFDPRPRIIKVKGLTDNCKLLLDYLDLVDDTNILVIDGPISYKSRPPSTRLVTLKTSNLYKKFKSQGKVFDFPIVAKTNSEAVKWAVSVVEELGKSINSDAANMLVDSLGKDLDTLYSAISKLVDYQSGKKISVEDVKACCVPQFLRTVWDLVRSLEMTDFNAAMSHASAFYVNTDSSTSRDGDFQMLMGALYHHFFKLVLYKDGCGEAFSYNNAAQSVSGFKKQVKKGDKQEWEGELFHGGTAARDINSSSTRQALKWSKKKVYEVFAAVSRARFYCRIAPDNVKKKMCLDDIILQTCGNSPTILTPDYRKWMV